MRVTQVQNEMRQEADTARKAASALSLWMAFALLLGAGVAIAAAISSRWMDDRVTFSLAPRRR
jgi:cell division septal protein FtsQ